MESHSASGETRLERKKEEMKQKIIAVAMSLFKNQGVEGTTMEQIANEADIAKGTLYNYFPVKEAIISEFIRRSFQEKSSERILRLREMPDTRSRMVLILAELMAGIRPQKEIFEKYLIYQIQNMISLHPDAGVKSGFELLGSEIIELGQKNGEIRSDLPFGILKALFDFIFVEVAQQFYAAPEAFNSRTVIEQCVDLFMDGAATPVVKHI
ncbi:TetR family transcriptional regulator [Hydrogenispora ethanolica]|uniref:TetR family transcriptional regulator n=1 Tax=Hydrogenispora ethanolica TaxID=1082276 RepID=A0A4R1SBE3_HYDET|nr:TetR/AcrR family transcriptional regulator [Hydrogenispora ethanolica]TCL76863.1 TetR family transcriptional regulator [Hydrogenispora ethanolica]